MKSSIQKAKNKERKRVIYVIAILLTVIIFIRVNKYVLMIDDKDLVIAQKSNYEIGSTVCFLEYGNLKVSKITGIRQDGSYITKMDEGIYNDQSKIYQNNIIGIYCCKIKYIVGIFKSKITLSLFLVILVYMLYELNNSKRKSNKRKIKKEEMS